MSRGVLIVGRMGVRSGACSVCECMGSSIEFVSFLQVASTWGWDERYGISVLAIDFLQCNFFLVGDLGSWS